MRYLLPRLNKEFEQKYRYVLIRASATYTNDCVVQWCRDWLPATEEVEGCGLAPPFQCHVARSTPATWAIWSFWDV